MSPHTPTSTPWDYPEVNADPDPWEPVLEHIGDERSRQVAAGHHNTDLPFGTGGEYFVFQADKHRKECDEAFRRGEGTFAHVLLEEVYEALAETDLLKLRTELRQAVAVGVGWLEKIEKRITDGGA